MKQPTDTFPIIDEDLLLSLPKANKPQDLERMYTSPNSEDWVTWSTMRLLERQPADKWWRVVVEAAERDAGSSHRWMALRTPPNVELWRSVPSPEAYEAASRRRMAESDVEEWRTRSTNARAVEGSTEVDLVFDAAAYLVFVEAKLHSDISISTTYDPDRNQIARNIDCVIEQAGRREPFFWMLVDDRNPERLYMELIERYRRNPSELHRLLPHRSIDTLTGIVETLAVITWKDLLPAGPVGAATAEIRAELGSRISPKV